MRRPESCAAAERGAHNVSYVSEQTIQSPSGRALGSSAQQMTARDLHGTELFKSGGVLAHSLSVSPNFQRKVRRDATPQPDVSRLLRRWIANACRSNGRDLSGVRNGARGRESLTSALGSGQTRIGARSKCRQFREA